MGVGGSAAQGPWRKNGNGTGHGVAQAAALTKRRSTAIWRPSCHVGEPSRGRVGVGGCPLHQRQRQQSPRTTTASIYPLPLAVSPAAAPFPLLLLLFLELDLPLPLVDRSPSPIPHPLQNKTRLGPVPSCIAELRRRFGRRLLRCPALPCTDECRRPQHSLISGFDVTGTRMSLPIALVVGIAAGGATLLAAAAVLLALLCAARRKARRNRNSDTGSSDPSTLVEWGKGGRSSLAPEPEHQVARQFSLEDLVQATKNFSDANIVGAGSFGLVYMGLLLDGTVVAIKRRVGAATQVFADEVGWLSEIRHRNIVTLIGYCQEGGLQMLVYEYLPNGSVCGHLYDTRKGSTTWLEFKQRLSIAIGAAKGLNHLHSLDPPLIHKDFKTNNVLVDENFIAKVADAGLVRLIRGSDDAGPSHGFSNSVYQDPEVQSMTQLSESSDVYSFGVFLLELITGREAASLIPTESRESLAHWVISTDM